MSEKKSTGWQNMRRQLDDWSKPALIALVKDLHDASPDNRDFLLARFQAEEDVGAALEKYRHKIVEQFYDWPLPHGSGGGVIAVAPGTVDTNLHARHLPRNHHHPPQTPDDQRRAVP
jgi:hypothetical protein